jgi:hypothetical protein
VRKRVVWVCSERGVVVDGDVVLHALAPRSAEGDAVRARALKAEEEARRGMQVHLSGRVEKARKIVHCESDVLPAAGRKPRARPDDLLVPGDALVVDRERTPLPPRHEDVVRSGHRDARVSAYRRGGSEKTMCDAHETCIKPVPRLKSTPMSATPGRGVRYGLTRIPRPGADATGCR